MPSFSLTVATGDALSVRHVRVRERMSEPFEVSVIAMSSDPSLDLEAITGRSASIRVETEHAGFGGIRRWGGVCSYIEQKAVETAGLSTYELVIVPRLWLLRHRVGNRIFQHVSIPEIADKLLGEWRIAPTWKVDRTAHRKLAFKVQYAETDHAFLTRLLEEAGIAYRFLDHDVESVLSLVDRPHEGPPLPQAPLRYMDHPGLDAPGAYVTRMGVSREVRPGANAVRDHDFRRPAFSLVAATPRSGSPEDRYERYEYAPGAFVVETDERADTPVADDKGAARHDDREGKTRAERGLEALRVGREGVPFLTNVIDLAPGVVFSALGHPHRDLDSRPLLVTELSMELSTTTEAHITGRAVPADQPYRPPMVTPKPIAHGVQSATVTGPADQEVHTDEFGRVRVQFPWDREGQSDDSSSCWIRVSQSWAGAGYGTMRIPRIGQEVLVAFLGGDPDQPVVVGRVFNRTSPVPYDLPARATESGWRSASSGRTGGFNELLVDDAAGAELFSVTAQRNSRKLVKHDEVVTVAGDLVKRVEGDEMDTTFGERVEVTERARAQSVGASSTTALDRAEFRLVKGREVLRVDADSAVFVGQDEHVVVKGERRERIEADRGLCVKGSRSEGVGGTYSLSSGALQVKVGGSHALEAAGDLGHFAGANYVGEAPDITLKGGGGFIRIDGGGVTIEGTLVKINAGGAPGSSAEASPASPKRPLEAT